MRSRADSRSDVAVTASMHRGAFRVRGYQKRMRLHMARVRMMYEGLDAASAAFEVGYDSATQFNREYRRLFCLPPTRDIKARQLVKVEQN